MVSYTFLTPLLVVLFVHSPAAWEVEWPLYSLETPQERSDDSFHIPENVLKLIEGKGTKDLERGTVWRKQGYK